MDFIAVVYTIIGIDNEISCVVLRGARSGLSFVAHGYIYIYILEDPRKGGNVNPQGLKTPKGSQDPPACLKPPTKTRCEKHRIQFLQQNFFNTTPL